MRSRFNIRRLCQGLRIIIVILYSNLSKALVNAVYITSTCRLLLPRIQRVVIRSFVLFEMDLFKKLNELWFSYLAFLLIQSYFINRVQCVSYNGYESLRFITTSVPQWSNLSPLLFKLFINVQHQVEDCRRLAFVDDF